MQINQYTIDILHKKDYDTHIHGNNVYYYAKKGSISV